MCGVKAIIAPERAKRGITMFNIHHALVHAVTEYDRKESTKRGYNMYALAMYIGRVNDVEEDVNSGVPLRQALLRGFNGRVLDVCLKAVGEPKFTKDEMLNQPITYSRKQK
jgi:hypothetical protein